MSVIITLLSMFLALLFFGVPTGDNSTVYTSSESVTMDATPVAKADGDILVKAKWLVKHQDDPTLKIVALTPPEEFAAGHIPGAVAVDWPELEITDTADPAIARWQGEVEAILTRLGVEREQTVVVYDGGTLFAARLWWVLTQLGHEDVRVLDGGLAAWREAGGESETGASAAAPATESYLGSPDPSLLAQLPEVEAAVGDAEVVLIDARTPEEYAAGHIPGAVNIPFTANAAPNDPKRWLPEAELRAMYEAAGVTPDKKIIPYCTTGVRSAVTFLTLRLLGFEDVALFTGSWAEWSADPARPQTTGTAP